ncbi:MAG: acyl-CoA dehydrogenase family protein [Alphaproteobacteria bacterium]
MDLAFSAEETAFGETVEQFVRDNLPPAIAAKVRDNLPLTKEDNQVWQRILNQQGWGAPIWPKEAGGPGWTAAQRYIFDEVCGRLDAPQQVPFGLNMVGPVIYTFGTDEQQQKYLPRILNMDDMWCQGYSEPGSGSDLASLQTRAVREGDHYIVNGTKTWTSLAHWADMMFCLVRTDNSGKPQEGISFLLIDMKTPGIEVKPIVTIDQGHHVNMTYLSDVKVPVENRIGEENKGWTYAKFLLGNERNTIAEVPQSKQRLRRLKEIARAERALDDPRFAIRVAEAEVALTALEYTNLRCLADEAAGKPVGPEASMLKIRGAELRQQITELTLDALGPYAVAYPTDALREGANVPAVGPDNGAASIGDFLFSRAATIYGGSNEIQRNIIAKMVLGL